ncbi:MAG TPA: sugar transferase [Rhabdochlamydiaceae bacterium]|nr:sugar transferase [Rhabdochlamydiaceae bacterium]
MRITKRVFDVLFCLGAMAFFLPIGLIMALLIKLTSPGSIFYSSKRVGKDGQPIFCWKFRTMHQDADKKLFQLLSENPKLKREWDTYFKLKDDPRVSTIGKILRKTSLDELPQFYNVLKGDLSVVGPRPVTEEEIQKYFGSKASKILSVRPGLTGIWQTSGRSLLTFEERIRLEESYIDRQSLSLDLRIICKTIPAMFFTKGAF